MTYRNNYKESLPAGAVFGAVFGLLTGLYRKSILWGICGGLFSGGLFLCFLLLFSAHMEKKFAKVRKEIAAKKEIYCDGPANLKGLGGWLFLTDYGLEFYPHRLNYATRSFSFPLSELQTVEVRTHRHQLHLIAGREVYNVAVVHVKEWQAQIEARLTKPQ